jgi:hypothetical protein
MCPANDPHVTTIECSSMKKTVPFIVPYRALAVSMQKECQP